MKNQLYILIILLISILLVGCDNHTNETHLPEELQMQDGEFEGLGEGRSGMIKVAVFVKNHIITAIQILSQSESKFAQQAEQQIIDAVLEKQTVHGGNRLGGNAVADIIVFGQIAGTSAVRYITRQ